MGRTASIAKNRRNAVMEKQSTHFICIIYPGKHNGTVLLYMEHVQSS